VGSRGTFVLSNYLKPSISSSVNRGHVAVNRSDGRTAEFVNIGRNVVVASKSESWCALSPIAGTGSVDEYITITQEYKGKAVPSYGAEKLASEKYNKIKYYLFIAASY